MNTPHNPFFSIITCTKNSERYLERNIKSVLNQTFNNYEYIFIDGVSDDDTVKLIKKNLKINKNIKLFSRKAKGMVDAMNYGTSKAKGNYIIHLNSDDNFYSSTVLEHVNKFILSTGGVDWLFGKIQTVDENDKIIGTFPKGITKLFLNKYILKYFNFVPHQSTFINRMMFKKYGYFDTGIKHLSEYDYWLKISSKSNPLFYDEIISNYRIWRGSSSFGSQNINNYKLSQDLIRSRYLNKIEYYLSKVISMFIMSYTKIFFLR